MSSVPSVLIVDSDESQASAAAAALSSQGYRVEYCHTPEEGSILFKAEVPDVLIFEHRRTPGVATLDLFTRFDRSALILAFGLSSKLDDIAAARDSGAHEAIVGRVEPAELAILVRRLLERRMLERQNQRLLEILAGRHYHGELLGGSAAMRSLYHLIDEVAPSEMPVLVQGEAGSDLLAVARSLHGAGAFGRNPAKVADLTDLPAEKVVEHLFGSRNAARRQVPSLVEEADANSLIVHEIGLLPAEAQARLLQVMNARAVERVGVERPRPARFRLISTSSTDLFAPNRDAAFSRELYYRINVAQIMVPPLRERLEDIPILASHFLRQANKKLGTSVESVALDALMTLTSYSWPQNVDELRETIMAAARSAERGLLTRQHLPINIYQAAAGASDSTTSASMAFRQAKKRFELRYFSDLLARTGGNMTQAAELSKVGRPYLYKKLQEYRLKPSDFRGAGEEEEATPAAAAKAAKSGKKK